MDIGSVLKEGEGGDSIEEGILVCSSPRCLSEYPIIDGIPVIVPDLRTYITNNVLPILGRNDLSDTMESLLGDCLGPGSAFDAQRQHLSTYAFDHYGDLDPGEIAPASVPPGSVVKVLGHGLEAMPLSNEGPVLDIGCSVGRTSFELAARMDRLVLGVDLNFGMLKVARAVLERGIVSYPKRKVGITFERREFPAVFEKSDNVDFWACDATALPFSCNRFAAAVSLNVLDCVNSPYDHLSEIARVLIPGSRATLATPYDWSTGATPVQAWLGGHSQRSAHKGASDAILRSLLAGGGHPGAIEELELVSEKEIPWTLRLHDRSSMEYQVDMVVVRKKAIS